MTKLDINPVDLRTVRRILAKRIPEWDVYVFGSRVTGTARKKSDLDLAVMPKKPMVSIQRADLKDAFTESDLPFKVDIVDWAATKEDFKKLIRREWFRIQKGVRRLIS